MCECVHMWCELLVSCLLGGITLEFVFRAQSLWVQPLRTRRPDGSPFADYLGRTVK